MAQELCVEWRERGKYDWSYATGTRGKSRGELTRLLTAWKARNPLFEFRIRPCRKEG
jgi:hypothetical protein